MTATVSTFKYYLDFLVRSYYQFQDADVALGRLMRRCQLQDLRMDRQIVTKMNLILFTSDLITKVTWSAKC